MHRLTPLSLVVGLLTALVLLGAAPAHAEGGWCTGQGVNVVVDFQELGGGREQACDEDGAGKTAAQVFEDAGFDLTPVGAFPGAACQVDGKPEGASCAQMPPANAYWGLFLGKDSAWDYAPKGADELVVQDGAYLGFSWQTSSTATPPGVAPAVPVDEDERATTQTQQQREDERGVPWWVPALVVVALVAGGITYGVRRQARGR